MLGKERQIRKKYTNSNQYNVGFLYFSCLNSVSLVWSVKVVFQSIKFKFGPTLDREEKLCGGPELHLKRRLFNTKKSCRNGWKAKFVTLFQSVHIHQTFRNWQSDSLEYCLRFKIWFQKKENQWFFAERNIFSIESVERGKLSW